MNKKGIFTFIFSSASVIGVFLAIVLLIFLFSGGLETTYQVSKILTSIPAFVWVIIGFMFLLSLIRGRR